MRIGIIGTGWGTRVQVPAFRAAGLDVVGIAGRDAAKTRAEATNLGVQAFADWQALVASDVELVCIVTPPVLHREMTLSALAAGKHVLCEKPTAMDATEAQAMLDAAHAHPTQITLIDHEMRFLPLCTTARSIVQSGALGELRHVVSTVINGGRADASKPWTWWYDAAQGGGILGAIGSHQVDTLRFLWGEIDAVSATLHTFIAERPFEDGTRTVTADDFAALQLRFNTGGIASISLNVVSSVDEPNRLFMYGSEGALKVEGSQLWVAGRGGAWEERTPADTLDIPASVQGDFPRGTVYLGHALAAYGQGDCTSIAQGATFVDGLRNQQVLDAARASHANNGAWIKTQQD